MKNDDLSFKALSDMDNFDNSKTNGFLIENSWGDKKGFNGNYYMAKNWFEDYTYQVVVDKKCVSDKILRVLKQKPITLPYWSVFGALLKGGRKSSSNK